MKKKFVTALIGTLVLSLAACTTTAPEAENNTPAVTEEAPTEAPTEAPVETPETTPEDSDEFIDDVIDKPDFTGTYTEPMSGRCTIDIEYLSGDDHKVTVRWASSAFESANWEMTATYYVSTGLLEYTNAKYYVRTYTDETTYTDDVKYTDGAGEFWFEEDGSLGWRSANSDIDGVTGETLFERIPDGSMGMANPWSVADNADDAAAGADVGYFMVPEHMSKYGDSVVYLEDFSYMEHLAEARGSIGSAELTIRKGLKQESDNVSGDYNTYAHSWSIESKDGFVINCFGNEEGKTMKAIWQSDNFSYSLNVQGQGDESDTYGLSDDIMKLIVEDIQ